MALNYDIVCDMQSYNARISRASEGKNLSSNYPDVAREWHPTKNGDKKPEDFRPKSNGRIVKRAGLNARFHDLRHTYATLMLAATSSPVGHIPRAQAKGMPTW